MYIDKEELIREAEKIAEKGREFIARWRHTNKGATDPPFYDPGFVYLTSLLQGFLWALYRSKICDEKETENIWKSAFPTFAEGVDLPERMPEVFGQFIETLNLDDFGGPKEEA